MNMNSSVMSLRPLAIWFALGLTWLAPLAHAQTNSAPGPDALPAWITRPLSLADALNIALEQNATILKAKRDVEASHGIVIQMRAVAIPTLKATGDFTKVDPATLERFPGAPPFFQQDQTWNAGVKVAQSLYEGGKIISSFRTARLTREQAFLNYQTAVADALLEVRIAYLDTLVAAQQIVVNESSVKLLSRELEDQRRRYDAGTVPRFNVLRAEVAVANARPPLIRARNAHRVARNNLANLLGYNLPREVWEDIPLQLTDTLDPGPYQVELPAAITRALENRTELGALRRAQDLRREDVVAARAGYKPSVQAFAGYGWRNSQFDPDLTRELNGWNFGGQLSWNIFDGMLTRGKVVEAKATFEKAKIEVDDRARQIELEVRTAYSSFIEAREVLESQQKVQEEAEEALRLANARTDAGTGTQLDVLNAETALTQARTTQVEALHDYAVARARLERAIGQDVVEGKGVK